MRSTPQIVVEDLSFRYLGRKRSALQNVSFTVAAGETLLVLGPSGGGKSTLALCLDGLIPHNVTGEMTGRVRVAGMDTRDTPVADLTQTVGLVFQDPDAQFCMLRLGDEIAFGLENLLVPPSEMPGRIQRALDQVGLAGRERLQIDRLSGGTRQRVALASILAMEPSVLVFDEPTSNLDPAGAEEVFGVIADLKKQGTRTLVIVEHRLDHLMGLVDKILVLGVDGNVIALGPPRDVLRQHAADLTTSGVWIPQVAEVANRLAARGVASEPYPTTVEEAAETFGRMLQVGLMTSPAASGGRSSPSHSPARGRGERAVLRPPSEGEGGSSCRTQKSEQPREATEPAIAVSHLSYTYPTGAVGLRDVSLTVPRGAFVAIVGPNGAGKTTLARHLIGSIRPPSGAVHVLGHDVRATPAAALARLVGYVFQNPEHQFVARTVFDELAFGLRIRGVPADTVQRPVDQMLARFGLSALARANPFALSHGEKRRLSVATMLILGQELLVLDEPTFGQDRKNTDALMAELVDLNRADRTIVMITHDPRLIAEYAESVVVLIDGAVAYTGSVDGMFSDPFLLGRARLALPPLQELGRRLGRIDPTFPSPVTVHGFVNELTRRVRPADAPELPSTRLAIGGRR